MESAPFVLNGGTQQQQQQQQAFSTSAFVDPNSSATDYRGGNFGGVGASLTSSPQQASSFKDRSAIASPSGSAAYVPSANVPSSTTTRTNATKDGKLVSIKTEMPRKGDEPAESHISIQNTTSDQYIVEYTFSSNSNVEAVGDTVVDGRTFRLNLYPHETKPFVCGIISGYKMSCRFGPPDEGYVPSTSLTDADLLPLVNRVRTVWRRSPAGTDVAEIASLCRNEGTPFIDIDFPPVSSAMVRSFELMQDEAPPIVMWFPPEKWLPKGTPAELCRSAVNPTALATSTDCDNGWLVSGMAALAEDPNLVGQIFSPTLASDEQMGLYSVWINKHGLWNIVTVDSYLPCRDVSSPQTGGNGANGSGGNSGGNHNNDPNNRQSSSSRHRAKGDNVTKYQLFGARAKSDENDIWPAILEKVFAKCHGSYYSLRHGDVLEALQDLTGFPVEKFDWTRDRDTSVFPSIHKALSTHLSHSHSTETAQGSSNIVMLATTTSAVSDSKVIRSIGLEPNGAFRVLAAVAVDQFRLILIRVSLKYEGHAWTGNWSEASDMWRRYPNAHKACQAAAANIEDIESCIWMEWRDVARYFGGCGVCYCRPHWLDVRIGNRFQKNKPACMVQVYVGGGGTRMFLGIHQKDRRGLPNTDPDHLYGAFLLTVVAAGATAGTWEILAQSHGGTFWRGRDAFLDVTFPPSQQPYYIIPRRYSAEGIKDTVLSLHVEHREVVTMALLETSDEVLQSLRYTPLNKFNPTADAMPISRVDCQLDREPATQLAW
ncbi:calpain-like cysteine peptidase, putative [Bodo saltans]|uniref:Calpain-like cysteine peptidase, putative n=1 Tax=Bodo saltans TaxID=75058 RepID=A0A0S4JS70_BODSA|nr:calpain-like cysteine peptidase, putative [Bodo saltans]|eukprot:CUG94368.1 calpain-like cysteine peptidase, putative [Bodo saltans]